MAAGRLALLGGHGRIEPDEPRRVTGDNRICGHVRRNNRAGAHDCALANGHAREHTGIETDPDVAPNANGPGCCQPGKRATARLALGESLDSVVLFALDQFCLIGYRLPLHRGPRRARFMGR